MERATWFRILVILGLFGMVIGALDPLEGSVIILPCVAIAALGVWMGHTRRRKLVYAGVALVAWGVAGMFLLSAIGGVGGTSGRSAWWTLTLLPYPVGWLLGLAGSILGLLESFRHPVHAPAA